MRNKKITVLHNPDEGMHLFRHTPTQLDFAVESHHSLEFIKEECIPISNKQDRDEIQHPEHLTVLEDFKIVTTLNREEYILRLCCPGQMKHLLAFIKGHTCFRNPEIVVTQSFFNHVYGIEE